MAASIPSSSRFLSGAQRFELSSRMQAGLSPNFQFCGTRFQRLGTTSVDRLKRQRQTRERAKDTAAAARVYSTHFLFGSHFAPHPLNKKAFYAAARLRRARFQAGVSPSSFLGTRFQFLKTPSVNVRHQRTRAQSENRITSSPLTTIFFTTVGTAFRAAPVRHTSNRVGSTGQSAGFLRKAKDTVPRRHP